MIKIDELNNLKTEYSDQDLINQLTNYYKGMPDITDEQVEKRVDIAKQLFFLIMMLFVMVDSTKLSGGIQDIDYYISMIARRYKGIVGNVLTDYIDSFARNTVNVTIENIDDEYYTSKDRALFIAENEGNTVENFLEFEEAIKNGAELKIWISQRDGRVRNTHKEVDDGKPIGIDDFFHVGSSMMLFPHDAVNGDAKEVIGCRCNVEYLTRMNEKSIDNSTIEASNVSDFIIKNDKELMPLNLTFFGKKFEPPTSDVVRTELLETADVWEKEELTDIEIKSLKKYTKNSGDRKPNRFFELLNAMLRGDIPKEERIMKYVPHISSAISKFKTKQDLILYRGIDYNYYKNQEVGKIFKIKQFNSASIYKDTALKKAVMMKILVPNGNYGAYLEYISEYSNQYEYLLDKDLYYRVLSNKEDEIVLEVIGR